MHQLRAPGELITQKQYDCVYIHVHVFLYVLVFIIFFIHVHVHEFKCM